LGSSMFPRCIDGGRFSAAELVSVTDR